MKEGDARRVVAAAFERVAPEVDLASLDERAALHEAAGLDSLDFLHLVAALAEAGVEVPERDYPALASFAGCVAYVAAHGRERVGRAVRPD